MNGYEWNHRVKLSYKNGCMLAPIDKSKIDNPSKSRFKKRGISHVYRNVGATVFVPQ